MDDCDEIVREFLVESHENLDRLDRELVELEKQPSNREILASIFRTIHTIKGTSGFLSFSKLEAVTHVGESLLAHLRDGHLSLNPERTTALLALVDAVRQMLAAIQGTGQDGDADHSELVADLTRLQQASLASAPEGDGAAVGRADTKPAQSQQGAPPLPEAVSGPPEEKKKRKKKKTEADAQAASGARQECEAKPEKGAEAQAEVVTADKTGAEERVRERASAEQSPAEHAASASEAKPEDAHPHEAMRESIRVDVGLLDKLMNLVGELVLARNQILQFTRTTEETNLVTTGQRLNLISTELQEGVMKTRMQPIGSVWSRLPRTVRDVALSCGKRVRIEMEGQETELDKTLIEAIKDPMTHLVRNAVDHGIERAEQRQAAGKGPEGLLKLRAYHEGGQVNIEISDDGAGLDLKKVVEKALQKGLIGTDQAARLSDREAANLIFLPGLSTAEKVTNVSGRGVGMDVVKTNIERIGGTVDVQSIAGKGTTVKVKIPLTLAIVPALIVTAAGQRFAIPQVSLLELVGLEREEARKQVELIRGAPVYRLRGSLLPLVRLHEVLKIGEGGGASAGGKCERVNIVVLQADGQRFGLLVDEISDTEEIVVKPLGKHLKDTSVFAGATIMGDGKVALILDVLGLAQHARVAHEGRDHPAAEAESRQACEESCASGRQALLLFQYGAGGRMAIDLAAVARLEEFSPNSLEIAGDQETVQYRGQIMPLVRVPAALDTRHEPAPAQEGFLQVVVVHASQGRNVGLVVDRILDIVDESYRLDRQTARHGVLGSAVIQRRITDVVDVASLIAAAQPALCPGASVS